MLPDEKKERKGRKKMVVSSSVTSVNFTAVPYSLMLRGNLGLEMEGSFQKKKRYFIIFKRESLFEKPLNTSKKSKWGPKRFSKTL